MAILYLTITERIMSFFNEQIFVFEDKNRMEQLPQILNTVIQ